MSTFFDGLTSSGYYVIPNDGRTAYGPYQSVRQVCGALGIKDYPDDGQIVSFDAESNVLGSVPSINPDDLVDGGAHLRYLTGGDE